MSSTNRARLRLASSQPDKIKQQVGADRTTASAGPPARPPTSTLLAMKPSWPSAVRAIPSSGRADRQVRITR